jgi:hypothetical protein
MWVVGQFELGFVQPTDIGRWIFHIIQNLGRRPNGERDMQEPNLVT